MEMRLELDLIILRLHAFLSVCVCAILDSMLMSFSRVFTHYAPTSEPESLTSVLRT